MIKGLIFDLDGTLLDTSKDLHTAISVMRGFYHLEALSLSTVQAYLGEGIGVLVEKALMDAPDISRDEALGHFHRAYAQCYLDASKPYSKMEDLLETCHQLGLKFAVVTNKQEDYAQALIEKNFPDISFELVLGEVSTRPRKPDSAAIELVLEKMNLKPSEVCLIGDSEVDVYTAKNAGIQMIAVTYGYRSKAQLQAAGARYFASSPQNCLETLACV